ncbi:hypothetical protein Leryth_008938 [Lithospermum erythrorhizon]|nr:hypothetical protein Leryth_008938 [Lithospermum erythrorhizon]
MNILFTFVEFNQVLKQKNISKRGEKRNGKAPKTRGDTFSLKNGLVSFSSAGVNSFIGDYGSKTDLFDVTKHIDDLSLNELLDGNYKCPIYSKDKVKEVTTSNENLLLSLRKAWSILELQKHGPSQKNSESDKSSAELSCYGSSSANRCVVDNEDLQTADCTLSPVSVVLDSNKNLNSPMVVVNLPLNPPIDVLNRLSLPPSKDLDSLLLDAIKPASSSRSNSDLRLGRLGSWRSGLPPFPWSQSSSAQPKSVADTIKLSTTRNSCQGRWARVENCVNHPNDSPRVVIDLESLTFDGTLVPSLTREMTPPHTEKKAPSANFPLPIKQIEESSALCSTSHDLPDEHSLGVLGAAQTLYGIASSSMKNPNGMSKWQTKPSEKQLSRIYKSKAKNRESGNQFVEPKSISGTGSILNADGVVRSKKLKLSVDVRSTKINGTYSSKRGPLNSSALRRVTSSPTPSKLFESTIPEMRNGSKNVVNRSCTMPPPSSRVIDNACGSRLKLR